MEPGLGGDQAEQEVKTGTERGVKDALYLSRANRAQSWRLLDIKGEDQEDADPGRHLFMSV